MSFDAAKSNMGNCQFIERLQKMPQAERRGSQFGVRNRGLYSRNVHEDVREGSTANRASGHESAKAVHPRSSDDVVEAGADDLALFMSGDDSSVSTDKPSQQRSVLPLPQTAEVQTADDNPVEDSGDESTAEPAGNVVLVSPSTDASHSGSTEVKVQQRRELALRRFQQLAEDAKAELRSRQEPVPQKTPRSLTKAIKSLEETAAEKIDDKVAQLHTVAKTGSVAAIDSLRDFANRRHPKIRQACATGFGLIDHASSSIALLDLLADTSPEVADAAVRSLLQLGHPEAIAPLVAMGTANVRSRTVMLTELQELDQEQCARLTEPLMGVLKTGKDAEAGALALHLLSTLRGSDLLKMYASLTKHKAAEVRVAAIEALVNTEEKQTVRLLNKSMTDPSSKVRVAAATGLAKINSPRSVSLLAEALQDKHANVRRSAARTLITVDGPEVATAASKALNAETDPDTIGYLLEVLAKGGTDDALVTLRKYVKSGNVALQQRAITTLRRLKNRKGAKMLLPFLEDDNDETRRLATEALGQLAEPGVLPALRKVLSKDSNENVRAAAARSLGELQDVKALGDLEEALHDERAVKCQAVIALGKLKHKKAVPALLAQLKDRAPEVRYHACNALGEIGELANPEPLQNLLDDKEGMVRRGAEAALTKLGHKFRKARFTNQLKKLASTLMPSAVAGALPGGTTVLAAVVALVVTAAAYFAFSKMDFASEPDFPISDVRAIAVSNDGTQATVARKYNVIEVWDLNSGACTVRLQADAGGDGIVYQQNGNALVLSGSKSFQLDSRTIADKQNDALLPSTLETVSTHRMARTPDGSKAVLCANTGDAVLVDLESGRQDLRFTIADFGENDSLAVSPDASLAFVGTPRGFLKVVSLSDGKAIGRLDIGKIIELPGVAVTALAIDSTGVNLAVGTSSGKVIVINTNELQVLGQPFSGKGRIVGLKFEATTRRLNVITSKMVLASCSEDFKTSRKLTVRPTDRPERYSFSVDGKIVGLCYAESNAFCVVDMAADRLLARYPLK